MPLGTPEPFQSDAQVDTLRLIFLYLPHGVFLYNVPTEILCATLISPCVIHVPPFSNVFSSTPHKRALLDKLTVAQLVTIFTGFYEIRRCISVFTGTCQWSLA
jgi:hypothetical protein